MVLARTIRSNGLFQASLYVMAPLPFERHANSPLACTGSLPYMHAICAMHAPRIPYPYPHPSPHPAQSNRAHSNKHAAPAARTYAPQQVTQDTPHHQGQRRPHPGRRGRAVGSAARHCRRRQLRGRVGRDRPPVLRLGLRGRRRRPGAARFGGRPRRDLRQCYGMVQVEDEVGHVAAVPDGGPDGDEDLDPELQVGQQPQQVQRLRCTGGRAGRQAGRGQRRGWVGWVGGAAWGGWV